MVQHRILHLLQNPYKNVVDAKHQLNHEVVFEWVDAHNYEGIE